MIRAGDREKLPFVCTTYFLTVSTTFGPSSIRRRLCSANSVNPRSNLGYFYHHIVLARKVPHQQTNLPLGLPEESIQVQDQFLDLRLVLLNNSSSAQF